MSSKRPPSSGTPNPKKRKDPPHPSNTAPNKKLNPFAGPQFKKPKPNSTSNPKNSTNNADAHRAKARTARHLAAQTTSKAFANGALDLNQFIKAREYEILSLEQGMRRSKDALNRRAFQQVPKDLRRRGAAHDAKRVVKRLRGRARREMVEDNTPTVRRGKGGVVLGMGRGLVRKRVRVETAKKVRAETVKRLRGLGAKGNEKAAEGTEGKVAEKSAGTGENTAIPTRTPKVKKATLAQPPLPKAKFRKRQKHKSWLPTHIFHAKRAHMTPPSAPMWRFALPLSPTQKSYRPTHRASSERGAICWDTSYMATIALEGEQRSVLGMLKALGVEDMWLTGVKGRKWRTGTRVLETMVYEREKPHHLIAPVTVIWDATETVGQSERADEESKRRRKLFLNVHPSAFFEVWEEVVRLSKVAKPAVHVEDLRFELGSIELKGPGSTEALLGALWPSPPSGDQLSPGSAEAIFNKLAGLTNAAMLPSGAVLAFSVQDPKLHFPPRTVELPKTGEGQAALLELMAEWPVDISPHSPNIFDRKARHVGSKLPSQKAVNRRKSLVGPGEYPESRDNDPRIPILLYASTSSNKQQHSTSWHLLAPWKAIQPIWYSLMYYPLSTGQQPRFGGLDEQRQLAFEAGTPWFPGDFPGTNAGWKWEVMQRRKRWDEWKKRPKSKRVSWESVQVGKGKEGRAEVGLGWACDWNMLLNPHEAVPTKHSIETDGLAEKVAKDTAETSEENVKEVPLSKQPPPPLKPTQLTHLHSASALAILNNPSAPLKTDFVGQLLSVRLTLLTRGVPQTCARIYRLPSAIDSNKLRRAWLALQPHEQNNKQKQKKHALPRLPKDASSHIVQQRLAASLLEPPRAGGDEYPPCPGKEDLMGFVTSGNFNLAAGKGTGVGCVLFERVLQQAKGDGEVEGRLCIVRNAGEGVGRLARWNVV